MNSELGMNKSEYVPPLREEDVAAMGLGLGPICDTKHRPGMKSHRHIAFLPDAVSDEPLTTHACPLCGDVHLPRADQPEPR